MAPLRTEVSARGKHGRSARGRQGRIPDGQAPRFPQDDPLARVFAGRTAPWRMGWPVPLAAIPSPAAAARELIDPKALDVFERMSLAPGAADIERGCD